MAAENAGTFFSTAGTASRSERSGVKTERRHAHGLSIPSIVVAIVAAVLWWAASPSQSPTSADRAKLRKIKGAMRASWNAYTSCAAPYDEVLPLSCAGQEWLSLALTAIDSLDTLLMMGLDEEYLQAHEIVRTRAFSRTGGNCNLFETTIRVVGGSLSGYYEALSSSNARVRETASSLLELAVDVGSRLMSAFDNSQTALPHSDVDLLTGDTSRSAPVSSLSEMTTLALEFATLTNLTGDGRYEAAARGVYDALPHGILPQYWSPHTGEMLSDDYLMLGARADSYYEYLLKYWIMTGKKDDAMKRRYRRAVDAIKTDLVSRTEGERGALYVAEMRGGVKSTKMDHLVCFLPGMLALGYWHGANDADELHMAEELLDTCVGFYKHTPTGLAAELSIINVAERGEYGIFDVPDVDAHNILRPETVESLFLMWAVTKKQKFRDEGWDIFRAFRRHCGDCGPAGGYCGILSVKDANPVKLDKMESFWTAETLKYFHCLFDDVTTCGDRALGGGWILNTEAHWLRAL